MTSSPQLDLGHASQCIPFVASKLGEHFFFIILAQNWSIDGALPCVNAWGYCHCAIDKTSTVCRFIEAYNCEEASALYPTSWILLSWVRQWHRLFSMGYSIFIFYMLYSIEYLFCQIKDVLFWSMIVIGQPLIFFLKTTIWLVLTFCATFIVTSPFMMLPVLCLAHSKRTLW